MKRLTVFEDEEFIRQISKEVDFKFDNVDEYIKDLRDYCSKNVVYALAPVQIGVAKRIIYIKNSKPDMENNKKSNYDEEIIYINPQIIKAIGHTRFLEGCESCSLEEDGVRIYHDGVVDRPYKIDIEYFDKFGEYHTKSLEGFEVTVFCHEYDHLNGIVHLDKTDEIFIMKAKEVQEYRNSHPYEIISKEGDFEI
ncbi:MAG: peptide deformylase [Bacilli bacterium]|nr:peptide deformylase [Bacilli bacterium]